MANLIEFGLINFMNLVKFYDKNGYYFSPNFSY